LKSWQGIKRDGKRFHPTTMSREGPELDGCKTGKIARGAQFQNNNREDRQSNQEGEEGEVCRALGDNMGRGKRRQIRERDASKGSYNPTWGREKKKRGRTIGRTGDVKKAIANGLTCFKSNFKLRK